MPELVRERAQRAILGSLRGYVRDLDPAGLDASAAVGWVDFFAAVERLAAAGKALAAAAAERHGVWRAAGDRSVEDWLAKRTGTTVADTRAALGTVARLDVSPAFDAAFRAGELSPKQADAISAAIVADRDAGEDLLRVATSLPLQKLRDEAARIRAAGEDQAERHKRIHRSRFWRRWTDPDGARCGTYKLTPDNAAKLEAATQPFIDAAIDHARATGDHEPAEAYAADGLVGLADAHLNRTTPTADTPDGARTPDTDAADGADAAGTPDSANATDAADVADKAERARGGRGRRRTRNRRELIALVDLAALQRGHTLPGETCEIPGIGPIPIDIARQIFGDALLRIVIRDGVDIRTVVHTGRTANAVQETAILVRDRGRCARPTCDWAISEIDHVRDWAETRITTLDQLTGLCDHDHDLKTRHGHRIERTPDGQVRWTRPDGVTEEDPRMPP